MARESSFKYMIGTDGKPDYVVMAAHDGFLLGIKPFIIIPKPLVIGLGFRLRSVRDEEFKLPEVDGVTMLPAVKYDLKSAWPKIKFQKADDKRASVNCAIAVEFPTKFKDYDKSMHEELIAFVEDVKYQNRIHDMLIDLVPEHRTMSHEDLIDYMFKAYRDEMTPPDAPEVPEAPSGQLIQFPPKKPEPPAPPTGPSEPTAA